MSKCVLVYCDCRRKPNVRDLIHERDSYANTHTLEARSEEMILDAQIDFITDVRTADIEDAIKALEDEVWYLLTEWYGE